MKKMRNQNIGNRKFFLATLLLIWLILPQAVGWAATVIPINWSRFTQAKPADMLSLKNERLLLNSVKYTLNYIEGLPNASDGLYDFGGYSEPQIRIAAQGAGAIGVALATGIYDPAIIGKTEERAKAIHAKLVKSLAKRHRINGGGWGNGWQTALWAAFAGFGAWLTWDDLDSETQDLIAKVVEREANRFNSNPPYANDSTSDSKAEENAWNATALSLAAAMMPNHPNIDWWRSRGSQWMLSAYARQSDLQRTTIVDGKPVNDWITGWNMREQGYVYNHNLIHPDYMCGITMNLYSSLFQSLAGRVVPEASIYNSEVVYTCLVDYYWNYPPYQSPGGTIYRDGNALIYYPQGTDWSTNRVDNYFEFDTLADILPNIDDNVSAPALSWAELRADYLTWMQSRFSTGQLYAANEWSNNWVPKETYAAWLFGTTYMAQWLKAQGGFMPFGNWNSVFDDTTPPTIPQNLQAQTITESRIDLSWQASTDPESGISRYNIYRDGNLVATSASILYSNTGLNSNTTYSYKVSAVNGAGLESSQSNIAQATTLPDSTPPNVLLITASQNSLGILFNEALEQVSAENISNYAINNAILINSVLLNPEKNKVSLSTSSHTENTIYTLSISNVRDPAGNPMPLTTIKYQYISSLVGLWHFDEAMGSVVEDSSGNNNRGTLINGPAWTTGKINAALSFDGSNDYVQVADSPSFDIANEITVSAWINPSNTSNWRTILSKFSHTPAYRKDLYWYIASGNIGASLAGPNGTQGTDWRPAVPISTNTWTHVALTYNGSTMIMYKNGQAVASTNVSGNLMLAESSSNEPLYIGRNTEWAEYFAGSIDEARIYNKALSASEILDLYNNISTPPVLYGDVNADGEIWAYDAALAAHIAVDLPHLDIRNRAAAEVSGDGEVSAYDAALIAQRAVGLIERFPVEG